MALEEKTRASQPTGTSATLLLQVSQTCIVSNKSSWRKVEDFLVKQVPV